MKIKIFKKVNQKLKIMKSMMRNVAINMALHRGEITQEEAIEIFKGRINSTEELRSFRYNPEIITKEEIVPFEQEKNSKTL